MADNDFEMIPVVSSQIAAVGYDADTQKMRIRFAKGGQLYEYDECTQEEFSGLVSAASVGQTFASTIKGVKPYRKIG